MTQLRRKDQDATIDEIDAAALARPIVLIGLMGAGKSSVGVRLADCLGVAFHDSDDAVVAAANLSIAEIFERYGEAHFRSGERRVIARLVSDVPAVIATGGGAYMDPQTRAMLRKTAVTVWLRADLDVLVARTSGRSHRPLLNQGDPRQVLGDLIAQRHPVYGEADIVVDSVLGQPHDDMVRRIIAALEADGRAFRTGAT